MKGRFSAAIISSFGLHALFLLALIFMWQARPFKIEPPAITVDIVTDANSDAVISSLESKADSKIDSGNPDGNNIPLPPPPAPETAPQPAPQAAPMEAAPQQSQPMAQPVTKPTPAPSTAPAKQITKQAPPTPAPSPAPMQRATQTQSKLAAKAPSQAKPSSTPFGAEFDLSAAMKSASGVDAKGRKAPNLGTSATSVSSSGGVLSNDLKAKIVSQMKRCWAEPEGGAASVTVVVGIKFNQNGAVVSTKLISPNGVGANSAQKIAIDNAMKAIRDCSPFNLPANRFNEWGNLSTMQFNTKQLK